RGAQLVGVEPAAGRRGDAEDVVEYFKRGDQLAGHCIASKRSPGRAGAVVDSGDGIEMVDCRPRAHRRPHPVVASAPAGQMAARLALAARTGWLAAPDA